MGPIYFLVFGIAQPKKRNKTKYATRKPLLLTLRKYCHFSCKKCSHQQVFTWIETINYIFKTACMSHMQSCNHYEEKKNKS